MKTQISRESYDSEKRYSGVYQQQGRMLTDADWNNLVEIVKHRLDDALTDVVGSGTPRHRKLAIVDDGGLKIKPGHLYADGVIAHLPGQPGQTINYDAQADLTSPRAIPANCIIYADVWERSVTALEDGALMDSALHGADTCTRTKTMLQVKWCDTGTQPDQLPKSGDAELTVTIREGITAPDDCDPCASEISVDSRTGNELFRLEVHDVLYQGNDPTQQVEEVWLKWSCENGAEQYALKDRDGGDIAPPDAFKEANRVYEFFNTETEQNLGVHPKGTPLPKRGEIDKGYSLPADGKPKDYVRRWDGYCVLTKNLASGNWLITEGHDQTMSDFTTSSEVTLDAASGTLQVGLESIHFELPVNGQELLSGDYWTVALREREIRAELDKKAADPTHVIPALLDAETPHGVLHHYLELATVDASGNLIDDPEEDRKYAFPPLTEMTRLLMAGGDGQEVVPGNALPQPLRVGVANGEWPVEGATVRFHIEAGGGSLSPVNNETDADGIAECVWTPDSTINAEYRVKATLVDPDHVGDASKDMDPPVYFYANLITADQVVYDNPSCTDSPSVNSLLEEELGTSWPDFDGDGNSTVKDVLDALLCKLKADHVPFTDKCENNNLYPSAVQSVGDALRVLCDLGAQHVEYTPNCPSGSDPTVNSLLEASLGGSWPDLDGDGRNTVKDVLDALLCQFKADHIPFTDKCSNGLYPNSVNTVAGALKALCNLSAQHIGYAPGCDYLEAKEVDTVQKAIDALCKRPAGGVDCRSLLRLFGRGVLCGLIPSIKSKRLGSNSSKVNVQITASRGTLVDGRGCVIDVKGVGVLKKQLVGYRKLWKVKEADVPTVGERLMVMRRQPLRIAGGGEIAASRLMRMMSDIRISRVVEGLRDKTFVSHDEISSWSKETTGIRDDNIIAKIVDEIKGRTKTILVPFESTYYLYLAVPKGGNPRLELRGDPPDPIVQLPESTTSAIAMLAMDSGHFALADTSSSAAAAASCQAAQQEVWADYERLSCPQENDGSVCLATVGIFGNKAWVCPDNREQILSPAWRNALEMARRPDICATVASICKGEA